MKKSNEISHNIYIGSNIDAVRETTTSDESCIEEEQQTEDKVSTMPVMLAQLDGQVRGLKKKYFHMEYSDDDTMKNVNLDRSKTRIF